MITIHMEWTVSRKTNAKDLNGITTSVRKIQLPPKINEEFNPARKNLTKLITLNAPEEANETVIYLKNLFPKFLKVTAKSALPVGQLMKTGTQSKKMILY